MNGIFVQEKKIEQERLKAKKLKDELDRKKKWEEEIIDKLANFSVRGKSKDSIIKEIKETF